MKKQNEQQKPLKDILYGHLPPQNTQAEGALIGAILTYSSMHPDLIDIVSFLKPEAFYTETNQIVFAAIQAVNNNRRPIDTVNVFTQLQSTNELEAIGGPTALTLYQTHSHMGVTGYANDIQDAYLKRLMIRKCLEIVERCYQNEISGRKLLDQSEGEFLQIGAAHAGHEMTNVDAAVRMSLEKIAEYMRNPTHLTGVPTGYAMLDKATRGWQPDDLIIIAARPSVGKTALALALAKKAMDYIEQPNVEVAFFSLEMGIVSLIMRMLSSESQVGLYRLQTGKLSGLHEQMLHDGAGRLANGRLWLNEDGHMTLSKLTAQLRRLKKKRPNLRLVVIDYLQLMSGDGKTNNREREIAEISRGLKELAKELHIAIIALSQLGRGVENRASNEPVLSDMRESGAIEQDADVVMLVWPPTKAEIEEDASRISRRYARIAKQRNGVLLDMVFDFDAETQRISEYLEPNETKQETNWKPVTETAYEVQGAKQEGLPF